MSTGRILIFETLMPHMLLRSVSVRPEKAPISAVVDVCGHLVACAGLKVNAFDFSDGSVLQPCAFVDLEFYIVSADVIKNYVVLGDAVNSVHFFRWRDTKKQGRHLLEVSRDHNRLQVTSTAFVVDEPALSMAAFDADGHVLLFEYAPHHPASVGGQRLMCTAETRIGSLVPCTMRMRVNRTAAPLLVPRRTPAKMAERMTALAEANRLRSLLAERQCVVYGTRDGGIGVVTPLAEPSFRRLRVLLDHMQDRVPWTAGVPPVSLRRSRIFKYSEPTSDRGRTLDGDALAHYAELELSVQKDFARRIGSSARQLVSNLAEIDLSVDLF